MTPDPHLAPADAAVACRSFPRRFRQVLEEAVRRHGVSLADLFDRTDGDGGRTPRQAVAAAVAVLVALEQALADASHDPPRAVGPHLGQLATLDGATGREPASELLDQIETASSRCADRIERTPIGTWSAQLTVTGHTDRPTTLDLVRHAVAVVAGHLRALERGLERDGE